MKKLILTLMASLVAVSFSMGAESLWMHDFEAAKAKAAKEGKPIFINFTGTDWCGWCIKLEKEVFSQKAFQDYAKENLVLVEVDFPKKKEQTAELKEQNKKLDKEYGVEGYPTLYLLDATGKKLTEDIGYREGGPEKYVEHLKSLIKK
ncbi:MAG: thioredoxin family protein [Verrucomicrobiota bacterium]